MNVLTDHDFNELLKQFPPVLCAYAYGSGVIKQDGYEHLNNAANPLNASSAAVESSSQSLPMVDMMFVVEDSMQWHNTNKQRNQSHYSTPFPMSPSMIASIQDNYGAAMWYNPMIPMNIASYPHRLMKYGVISRSHFLKDLLDWKYLYIAGRLHKPVRCIQEPSGGQLMDQSLAPTAVSIDQAIETNKSHAMATSLLLLPETFSDMDLFLTIASLSYLGDPRMGIGENPNKV